VKPLDVFFALKRLRDARFGIAHRATLYALLAHVEEGGVIAPSVAQVAAALSCDKKTVRRAILDLETWAYLSVKRTRIDERKNLKNRYEIVLPTQTGVGPEREYSQAGTTPAEGPGYSQGGTTVLPQRDQGTPTQGVSESSSETFSETSTETHTSESPSAPVPASAATTTVEPLKLALDEETTKSGKRKSGKDGGDVELVWHAYLTAWRKNGGKGHEPKLSPKRRAQIRARLRAGFTVDRLSRAFDALFASPHHRGETNGTTYLDIEQVIRADERIEIIEATATRTTPVRAGGAIKQAATVAEFAPWRTAQAVVGT
jgi:hypothetical protein